MFNARSGEIETDRFASSAADPGHAVLRQTGQWLREARLQRGLEPDDVAAELRIRPAYLEALETGDLAVMPGRPYALGFLRTYALYLGLDGDELVRRVKAAERDAGGHPELSVPTPVAENRLPRVQLVALSVALVAGLYGAWLYVNGDARPPAETVAEVPDELRDGGLADAPPAAPEHVTSDPVRAYASESPDFMPPSVGADAVDPAPPDSAPDADPDAAVAALAAPEPALDPAPALGPEPVLDAEPLGTAPGADPAAAPTGDVPESAAESEAGDGRDVRRSVASLLMEDLPLGEAATAGPDEAPWRERDPAAEDGAAAPSVRDLLAGLDTAAVDRAREPRVYGREAGEARVRLEATETSWIQVRSADSTYTYTRTLQPGDVYVVPNRTDLALWTGNAGGLRVVVDGRALPRLGAPREVKRDIPLDPEALLAR